MREREYDIIFLYEKKNMQIKFRTEEIQNKYYDKYMK